MKKIEVGEAFGRLTVLYVLPRIKRAALKYVCECECGKQRAITVYNLKSGNTKSCGCLQRERVAKANKRHNYRNTRIYKVWQDMKARCYAPNQKDYHNYGVRGIAVYDTWRDSPKTFCDWALKNGYRQGLQLDRIDNSSNYDPSNCRFVTPYENSHNKRTLMRTNSSGFAGVSYRNKLKKFRAGLKSKLLNGGKTKHLGCYDTAWQACQARNDYITKNNLPHRIQYEKS